MAKGFAPRSQALLLAGFQHGGIGLVQVHQHDHADFHGDTRQCNEPDPPTATEKL